MHEFIEALSRDRAVSTWCWSDQRPRSRHARGRCRPCGMRGATPARADPAPPDDGASRHVYASETYVQKPRQARKSRTISIKHRLIIFGEDATKRAGAGRQLAAARKATQTGTPAQGRCCVSTTPMASSAPCENGLGIASLPEFMTLATSSRPSWCAVLPELDKALAPMSIFTYPEELRHFQAHRRCSATSCCARSPKARWRRSAYPAILFSCRSWIRASRTTAAMAPISAQNMSACVSQGSPCVAR